MLACIRAYRDVGYDGMLRTDHVPTLEGDSAEVPGYSRNARLFAIGYIKGLLEVVGAEPAAHDTPTKPTGAK
jgi:mannonate dehydratase